jgi:hypothetical protein
MFVALTSDLKIMGSWRQRFVVLFCATALLCASGFADQQHKTHKSAQKKEAVAPQPAPVAPPPPPPTPEQMPATPAQVTYQNNQLTILARNSTVGDILRAVRKQTGASVDAPPNASQRVVGQFGPGPARDVLASVLDASGFNYVLLGSPSNPNALQNVIVTVKSNEPETTGPQPQPQQAANQDEEPTPADDAEQPDQGQPSESFVPQDNSDSNSDQSSDDQSSQPAAKTPEQLLQELQRQQQLQQLQQRQQNQGSSTNSSQPNQMQQIQR